MLQKAGLDFAKHETEGIEHRVLAQALQSINLIRNPKLTWVAFNSSFDFAYMAKLMINSES